MLNQKSYFASHIIVIVFRHLTVVQVSSCSLTEWITPKICRLCVCVLINKRSFEPFICLVHSESFTARFGPSSRYDYFDFNEPFALQSCCWHFIPFDAFLHESVSTQRERRRNSSAAPENSNVTMTTNQQRPERALRDDKQDARTTGFNGLFFSVH